MCVCKVMLLAILKHEYKVDGSGDARCRMGAECGLEFFFFIYFVFFLSTAKGNTNGKKIL